MNPILRKLSKHGLSYDEVANLLEKHIGSEASFIHCEEAIAALDRISNMETSAVAHVVARFSLVTDDNPCIAVGQVIEHLRQIASSK